MAYKILPGTFPISQSDADAIQKATAADNAAPAEDSLDSLISAQQALGQEYRNQFMPRPLVPQAEAPTLKGALLNALLGGASAVEASKGVMDPIAASLAGMGGGMAGPAQFQANINQLQAQKAQSEMAAMEMTPIEQISPKLVQAHPELAGMPLAMVKQIAPILERQEMLKKAASEQNYNLDQAAAVLNPDGDKTDTAKTRAQLEALWPSGIVPKDAVHQMAGGARAVAAADRKMEKDDEKSFSELSRRSNPAVAPRGSLLGIAGQMNSKAQRALETLSQKNPSPQNLNQAIEDMVSIFANGRPNEEEMKSQGYSTIANKIAEIKTYWTNAPSAANQPEIVERLKSDLRLIKQVDNNIIKENLDIQEASYPRLTSKYPEQWKKLRERILGTLGEGSSSQMDRGALAARAQAILAARKGKP